MNKYLIILIFITCSAFAETVTVTGTHTYSENVSTKDGCDWARKDAFIKAKEQALGGKKFRSEETEMCNEVDGKTSCVRNKLFLSESIGEITDYDEIKKETDEINLEGSNEEFYICKITIKANVEKLSETLDSSYDFNISFNRLNFREGENLKIDIKLSKPIYLNIFQWVPYENKKKSKIYKFFPNPFEKNNYIETKNLSLPLTDTHSKKAKYVIEFPKNIDKDRVDEWLIFIFSKEYIDFFPDYPRREDLIKEYMREKSVKLMYKGYTIIKE